jgi:DNA-binding GntR family transcriptional regulator
MMSTPGASLPKALGALRLPGVPKIPAAAKAPAAVPGPPAFLNGAAGALPSRTVAVLEAIKHAILAGELRPGQALVETDLAEVLGVSKTPVREALKTLAGAGLVIMNPYKGAAVRVVDDEQARHVYDARLLLEPEALARAVTRGNDWHPAHQALARAGQAADQAERSLANRDFHRELYVGCGNPLLVRMLDDLRDQTALVSVSAWRNEPDWRHEPDRRHEPGWRHTPSWEYEAGEHRAVLQAAEDGDAERAAGLLRGHIRSFAARNFPELRQKQPQEQAQENQSR